jgi:TolB-like protein
LLRRKAFYRIIALLVLIILLSVATCVFEKNHPYFLQEPLNEGQVINQQELALGTSGAEDSLYLKNLNKPEKKIDKPSELIKSYVDLRYGRHKEYMRVVFDGPLDIISKGKVRHKDNEVSVTFTDSEFFLKEEKFPIPFRREKNKVIFQENNLEKIRTLNLSNPSRLVIDFYTVKADSDQHESSQIEKNEEGINTRIAVVVEQVLQVLDNKEQKVKGQKLEISEKASNIEKNEDLVSKGLDTRVSEMVERVLQVLDNKEQKVASQMSEKPENKATIAEVAATAPAVLMMPTTSEAQPQSTKHLYKAKTNQVETLKTSKVSARTLENKRSIIHNDTAKVLEVKTGVDNINKITSDLSKIVKPDIQVDASNSRIAILPFDNFSGNNAALGIIMPLIISQLKDRGYDVIDYKEVEAFLCERRIRNASFISREVAIELGKNKMVNTIIAGSVLTFSTEGNPKIGILARQLELKTGHVIWSDFVSLTGEDYTRVLGLGTIKSIDTLIPNALNNLFATLGNNLHEKENNTKYRIAVLPFKNESKHRHAGIIITHLFQNELANNPMFDPVDYGDVKKTIVNLRLGRKGEVDYNNLQALSKLLGVDVVLTGTVEEYQSGQEYLSTPRITMSARLLDSRRNRIIWYDNLQSDGEENIIALDWGRLRSADKVAYGAVSGLVENIKTEGLLRLGRLRSAEKVTYGAVSGLVKNIKTEGLLR